MKKITPLLIGLMLLTSTAFFAVADKQKDDQKGNNDNEYNNHTGDHNNKINNDNGNETNNHNGNNEIGDSDNENGTHENYDNETEHEVEIMNTTRGAEIRLLQLEKALITNIIKGAMTVQVLKGLSVNINTTKLEATLVDLRDVLDDVKAADPAANNSVQIFVTLKNQTINLTKQFRGTVRTLVDNETISMIKELLRNPNLNSSGELQNCSKKLRNQIRRFNVNQLYRLYGTIGETNDTLINEYLNGTITLNQTKLQIHKLINQMPREKQYQIYTEAKEYRIKKEIRAHESIQNIKQHGKGNGHEKQH